MSSEGSPEPPQFSSTLLVDEYINAFLSQLNESRCVNHLCDVTVVAQGREFRAHRAVLAASGGFFGGLFAADMKEKSENTVQLNEVDLDVVEDLLKFIYTGEIVMTRDNAQALAIAADFLLLEQLKGPVDRFLAEHVLEYCPSVTTDIVPLYLFASQYKCTILKRKAIQLIRANFESVVAESPDFLDLSEEVLQSVIAGDDLKVSNEEVVVRAVIEWVKHKEERKEIFQELFSNIRLCSLSEEFLNSFLVNEPLITQNPICLRLVLSSMKARYVPGTPTAPNKEHPRDCFDSYTDVILVFLERKRDCGYAGPWCYVPSQNKWFELPTTSNSHGHGIPLYHQEKGLLYLVRDHFENPEKIVINSSLEIAMLPTNYSNKQLTLVSKLNQSRASPYVVSDERYVYILGGYVNTYTGTNAEPVCTDTVERYDPSTNTCENVSPMKYKSCYGQCTITRNKIYVIHQDSLLTEPCTNEVYDISTDIWATIQPLPLNISMNFLTVSNDHLYLIGTHMCYFETLEYDTKYDKSWLFYNSEVAVPRRKINEHRLPLGGTVVRLPKQLIASFKLLTLPSNS